MKKIVLYFIFICELFTFSFLSNSACYAVVSDKEIDHGIANLFREKNNLLRSVRFTGKAIKYTAAAVCLFYAINGVKNTVESLKLLLPESEDSTATSFLKFPFRLMLFPFNAISVGRSFFISSSFATCFYFLHKIGV